TCPAPTQLLRHDRSRPHPHFWPRSGEELVARLLGVTDAVAAEIAADMGALHGCPTSNFADVPRALGVERSEVLALEPSENLALGVLEGSTTCRRRLARGDERRQVLCEVDRPIFSERESHRDDVAKLANVARPVVAHEAFEGIVRDAV